MSETYCDIIPQAGGWAYVFEGRHSAIYPSYRLAFEAAQSCSDQQVTKPGRFVLRSQDLRGRMLEIHGRSDAWSPATRPTLPHASGSGQA